MTFTRGYREHDDLRIKTVKNSCSPVYFDLVATSGHNKANSQSSWGYLIPLYCTVLMSNILDAGFLEKSNHTVR